MKVLQVCVLLAVTIGLGSCYNHNYNNNYNRNNYNDNEKSFKPGVYITTTVKSSSFLYASWTSYARIALFGWWHNSLVTKVKMGPLIVQIEQKCPSNSKQQKFVFSRALLNIDPLRLPLPKDKSLKLDFQLETKNIFYAKKLGYFDYMRGLNRLNSIAEEFAAQLKHDGKFAQTKWYYIAENKREIWFQKMTGYLRKGRKSCPPDDSNIQQLCGPNSSYSCPNTTYSEKKDVEIRNMDMYIVTGKAQTYEEFNCSFNYAVYDQYLGNHYYFMGNNTRHLIMKRTVPVMFKTTLVYNRSSPCLQKYQTQFFVSSKALGGVVPPCPTDPAVMLQKINMEVYVKTYNGNGNGDMVQLKNLFMQELTSKGLPYLSNQHYKAVFRGHGPILGHRMEIWVFKTQPSINIVC